jgi:hypothetical protein
MTPKLSPKTTQLIEAIFNPQEVKEASYWIEEECGNKIPFYEDRNEYELERIRFAAIKLSNGGILDLLKAIDLAQIDWRDLLMGAGFGNVKAHETWAKNMLEKR